MRQSAHSDLLDGFAPWDGRRVPVTLLGGYLGSGKTTAINELLARTDRPIAVIVNDVGAVNVDASLIDSRDGDTIELTDGCVCCSLNEGLAEAFDSLRNRPAPPEHVVLELSGVADPSRVIPWTKSLGFRLDGVIVLVDCDQYLRQIDDPIIGATVQAQMDGADLLLLTKTDIVGPDRVEAIEDRLKTLLPDTPAMHSDSPMATAAFLNLGTRQQDGFGATPDPSLFDIHTTSLVKIPDPIDLAELEELIAGLDSSVLRAKAIVRDHDDVHHLVQVVGRRRTVSPLPFAEQQSTTDLVVIRAKR
jgi:G3E family GTPase